jgi:hypothetical protein
LGIQLQFDIDAEYVQEGIEIFCRKTQTDAARAIQSCETNLRRWPPAEACLDRSPNDYGACCARVRHAASCTNFRLLRLFAETVCRLALLACEALGVSGCVHPALFVFYLAQSDINLFSVIPLPWLTPLESKALNGIQAGGFEHHSLSPGEQMKVPKGCVGVQADAGKYTIISK